MNKELKREDVAARRLMLITPLLEPGLDPATITALKKEISQREATSPRSLGRYITAYYKDGFDGLKPKTGDRRNAKNLPSNYDAVVEQAVILRRELPSRSVPQIITILEMEGYAKPGELKRSTLQGHLLKNGYGSKQMKLYRQKGSASRRFQKKHRGMLYQGDIKYGPYLPIGKNGKPKQVYLSAFIDDATRYIVHAKFYDNQKVTIIENSLRSALMQYGKPDAIYVDNGKQYRSKWLTNACAKLDIRLQYAKPYHPEGKGKIESFNKYLDAFLAEAALSKPKTLAALNQLLDVWIHEYYHKKPHTSLGDISPEIAFKTDTRALTFVDVATCAKAFLHLEERKVDKTGCINFAGQHYEVGMDLIGRKVDIRYDPQWLEEIEIHHKDKIPFKIKQRIIGENCGCHTELPEGMSPREVTTSRLLDGLNKANITNRTKKKVAVLYGNKNSSEDELNV
jgi:transposase InsO family protein